jgi:galactitol-specific phosphotransferase system IIB component
MVSKKPIKKRIMLVCGSGIVSSTLILPPVEDILEKIPYRCQLIKGTFNEIPHVMKSGRIDLILTTVSPLPKEVIDTGIPVVVVTPLFKGQKDEVAKSVLEALERAK